MEVDEAHGEQQDARTLLVLRSETDMDEEDEAHGEQQDAKTLLVLMSGTDGMWRRMKPM